LPAPPPFASQEAAAEMAELYWLALMRDVAFSEYTGHPLTTAAIGELRAIGFGEFNPVTLEPWRGEALTLGGAINKAAGNIAFARDAAGVHFRSDSIRGLRLGEAAAIGLLTDYSRTYNERFDGFVLTKFDGTKVEIANGAVQAL